MRTVKELVEELLKCDVDKYVAVEFNYQVVTDNFEEDIIQEFTDVSEQISVYENGQSVIIRVES